MKKNLKLLGYISVIFSLFFIAVLSWEELDKRNLRKDISIIQETLIAENVTFKQGVETWLNLPKNKDWIGYRDNNDNIILMLTGYGHSIRAVFSVDTKNRKANIEEFLYDLDYLSWDDIQYLFSEMAKNVRSSNDTRGPVLNNSI